MANVPDRCLRIIQEIQDMEQAGVHRERIEAFAREAARELHEVMHPGEHPIISRLRKLIHRYSVD